jgi:hypothetical protein
MLRDLFHSHAFDLNWLGVTVQILYNLSIAGCSLGPE